MYWRNMLICRDFQFSRFKLVRAYAESTSIGLTKNSI